MNPNLTNPEATIPVYVVRVRDVYCGVRGQYVEEQDVLDRDEANRWLREWKSMYSREDGYSVKLTVEQR